MKTPPLKTVMERFGDKAKLVGAVQALATEELWIDRMNAVKGLARVSNAKLLRLHATLTEVKKAFGSRAKLIDSLLASMKRQKDTGLRSKLESYSTPRLFDLEKAAKRRAKVDAKPKAEPGGASAGAGGKEKPAPRKTAKAVAAKKPEKSKPAKRPAAKASAAKKKTAKRSSK